MADNLAKLSSSTASNLDAVQLMTVHKAKGLEAKIVIYAMPNRMMPKSKMWVKVKDKESLGLPVAFVNMQKCDSDFDDDFKNERLLEEMDRINNLYVALTRPEQKLLIFCEKRKKWSDLTDDISLLHSFAKEYSGFKSITEDVFAIGDDFDKPQPVVSKTDTESRQREMIVKDISYPAWEKRISIASQNDALLSSLQTDNRRFGVIVHDLLAHIETVDDVGHIVNEYCEDNNISADDARLIVQRITTMMQKEDNQHYFDPHYTVKCEASIAVNGQVRRPDRIVFASDHTWVVDFKTGAYNDKSHRKYERQVAEYAAVLTKMGYPDVRPVIIYL